MKVLAIDPGYDRVGVAVLMFVEGRETVLFSTCLETDKTAQFSDRLLYIGNTIESILIDYAPDCLAIETLFFNKNVKTGIKVAEARGVILYCAKKYGCLIYEFGPQEIKSAMTGYGKSDKAAVYAMVRQLVANVPLKGLDDEFDAIAVGVTCLAQYGRGR